MLFLYLSTPLCKHFGVFLFIIILNCSKICKCEFTALSLYQTKTIRL